MCPLCAAAAASVVGTVWLWASNFLARRRRAGINQQPFVEVEGCCREPEPSL